MAPVVNFIGEHISIPTNRVSLYQGSSIRSILAPLLTAKLQMGLLSAAAMKMPSNSRLQAAKWLIGTLCVTLCAMVCLYGFSVYKYAGEALTGGIMARDLDKQQEIAFEKYLDGSFAEATNKLGTYSAFLEKNEFIIAPTRDIDLRLYLSRSKLAYMFACAESPDDAVRELRLAYYRHKRRVTMSQAKLMPRDEFVEFILTGYEKLSAVNCPRWRVGLTLRTGVVERIRGRFKATTPAEK